MATANLARFTINGTPSEDANGKRGYDTGAGASLAITLEANPALGVLTITYDVYDSSKSLTPLNSLYASTLTFTENGLKSFSSSAANTTVHIAIPAGADISAYTIRATAVTATGANVFERLVCIRKNGLRMTIPAESLQYAQRGWSDALNELTKLVADGGATVSLVTSSATGVVAAFPAGSRRLFHSDGATGGGTWAILGKTDLDAALASASIDYSKVAPGTNGQVLRTVGSAVAWGADVTLNRPANPGENGYVAVGLNGDLDYILIGDAQLATNAAITVAKLAPGANNQVLRTVGTTVVWGADQSLMAPLNPADDGKVALASGGDLVYNYIGNAQVASNAAIAVSKLAAGTEGYVLMIVSGVPTWAVGGGGGTNLPATPADDGKVAFANAGNLDYADGVFMRNTGTTQNVLAFSGFVMTPSSSEPLIPTGSEHVLWNLGAALLWTDIDGSVNVLRSEQPIHTTDDGKVAVARYGFYVPELLANESIASNAAIAVSKLAPANSENKILKTLYGYPTWDFLTNSNIAYNADIGVSKLAAGNEGDYLRTIGGATVWSAVLDGGDITNGTIALTGLISGSAYTVLVSNASGVPVWTQLTDSYISSTAAIAVTKLAVGSINSVLASNGTSNFWDNTPTVTSLYATSYLESQGYLSLRGMSEPGTPVQYVGWLYTQGDVIKAKFYGSNVWEIAPNAWVL